jgi:hypothetical protein
MAERQNFAKYLKRLLLFAIISQPLHASMTGEMFPMNILFSFMLPAAWLWIYETARKKGDVYWLLLAFASLGALMLSTVIDYGLAGFLTILSYYFFAKNRALVWGGAAVLLTMMLTSLAMFIPILGAVGVALVILKPLKSKVPPSLTTRWAFYIYYPAHILVINLLVMYFK